MFNNVILSKKFTAVSLIVVIIFNIFGGVFLLTQPAQAIFVPVFDAQVVAAVKGHKVVGTLEWSKNWVWQVTESALKYAAYIATIAVLDAVTNSIIEWINGGFDGKPGFVTDWRGILDDAVDQAGGQFLNDLAGINLCNFKPSLNITALLAVPSFKVKVECDLSDIQQNFNNLKNDLHNGDWTNWLELTQAPAKNPMNVLMRSLGQKVTEEQKERERKKDEAIAGRGFLAVKDPITGKITTPSAATESLVNKSLTQQYDTFSRSVAAFSASLGIAGPFVVAIGSALVNKVLTDGLANLTALAQDSSSGGQVSPDQGIIDTGDEILGEVTDEQAKTILGQYINAIDNLIVFLTPLSAPLIQVNNIRSQTVNYRNSLVTCENDKLTVAQTALNACLAAAVSCPAEQGAVTGATGNVSFASSLKTSAQTDYDQTNNLVNNYNSDKTIAQCIIGQIENISSYNLSNEPTDCASGAGYSNDKVFTDQVTNFKTEAAYNDHQIYSYDLAQSQSNPPGAGYSGQKQSQALTDLSSCSANKAICQADAIWSSPPDPDYSIGLNACANWP